MSGDELLTEDEHRLVGLLGECAGLFGRVSNHEASHGHDMAEAVDKIHQLQAIVLAQAAHRAYPDRYRPIGGWPAVVKDYTTGKVVRPL